MRYLLKRHAPQISAEVSFCGCLVKIVVVRDAVGNC